MTSKTLKKSFRLQRVKISQRKPEQHSSWLLMYSFLAKVSTCFIFWFVSIPCMKYVTDELFLSKSGKELLVLESESVGQSWLDDSRGAARNDM